MRQSKWFIYVAAMVAIVPALHATPVSASMVSDVYSGGAAGGPYTLTGTVSGVLNVSSTANTFILQDSTGSVIDYGVSKTIYTATVGDNITLTSVPDSPYQDAPELTAPASVAINSTGNVVTYPVLTIPEFMAAGDGSSAALTPYGEAIVTLDNVYLPAGTTSLPTNANTTFVITDGTNTTNLYDYKSDSAVVAAATNANAAEVASGNTLFSGPLDITGYVDVYYGVPEIYPISIVAAPEPASISLLALGGISMLARRRSVR